MANSFGRQVISPVLGNDLMVLAVMDDKVGWKPGGITVDWGTVTAVSGSPVTLIDHTVVAVGQKALRYGQVMCQITNGTIQTVTITGAPNGGSYTLGVTAGGSTQTTGAIAFDATATVVRNALVALSNVGTGNATVTGSAGGPWTVSFVGALLNTLVAQMAHTDSLTGGTSPAVVVAVTNAGEAVSGAYGPYDAAALDGRATLTKGACYLLNRTVLENGILPGLPTPATAFPPGVFETGLVWKARVIFGAATHELGPAGPSVSALEAVLGLRYAQ
jgi:hypothetical protein